MSRSGAVSLTTPSVVISLISTICLALISLPAFGQQETIPATSPMEDHGAYAINLQNLSIVVKTSVREKPGLIPFSASASNVVNLFTGGTGSGGAYLGAPFTVNTLTTIPNLLRASATYNLSSMLKCADGTTYWQYYDFAIRTPDGSSHKLYLTSGRCQRIDDHKYFYYSIESMRANWAKLRRAYYRRDRLGY